MPSRSGTDAAREDPDGRFAAPPVLSKSVLRVYVLVALVIVGLGLGLWALWVSGSTSARIAALLNIRSHSEWPSSATASKKARRRCS